jgi:hypothetical protein
MPFITADPANSGYLMFWRTTQDDTACVKAASLEAASASAAGSAAAACYFVVKEVNGATCAKADELALVGTYEITAKVVSKDGVELLGRRTVYCVGPGGPPDAVKVKLKIPKEEALSLAGKESIFTYWPDSVVPVPRATTPAPPPKQPEDGEQDGEYEEQDGGEGPPAGQKGAIDVPPSIVGVLPDCARAGSGPRLIVTENLSVHGESSPHMSHGKTLTVRFVVRKAVACRYFAAASKDNVYSDKLFAVGPDEPFDLLPLGELMAIRAEGDADKVYSCGMAMKPTGKDPSQYAPETDLGEQLTCVDFRFGPYTNDLPSFDLYRFDRAFTGWDLKGTAAIANHGRYNGWFEAQLLTRFLDDGPQSASVVSEPGSEIRRVHVDETEQDLDFAVAVKWLMFCNGDGNDDFEAMDLHEADVCWGFNTGISALDPANRWYPIGMHLSFAFLSLDVMLNVERVDRVNESYPDGLLFGGEASDIPTNKETAVGVAAGVGIDPVIFGRLLKSLVMGKGG